MDLKLPFTSKRLTRTPDPEPIPAHLMGMGWSDPATDPGALPLDPWESERSARQHGAAALADLAERDAGRRQAAAEARLAGVQRGYDYNKGLNYRDGS